MGNVVPKEGPRAPLFCSAITLLLSASLANAQAVDISALERCAGLETDTLKLACFDAIIAKGQTAVIEAPSTEAVDSAPPVAMEAANASQVPAAAIEAAPQAAESIMRPPAATVPSAAASAVADKPPAVIESASRDAKPPVTTQRAIADDLGREQLAALDDEENKVVKAMVVDVTQGYNKDLHFHLANGQVWRQIEPRFLQYPKNQDFEIEITRGILGSYRMRIGEDGRMVKIRRTK